MKRIILSAAILEVLYLGLSFTLSQTYGQWSVTGEIIRTGLRVISIVFLGFFYQKYFYNENQAFESKKIRVSQFNVAIVLFMVFAILYSNAENETLWWQFVFVISGFAAGLREELFYRGIIQNALQRELGSKSALAYATVFFTLSHVQYLYYGQTKGLLMIAMAGVIFGSIFIYTGSIVFTAVVHGLYDALLSVDIAPFKLSYVSALLLLFLIMTVFITLIDKQTVDSHALSNTTDDNNPDNWSLG